jgi:large subunit ribosomal protein L30
MAHRAPLSDTGAVVVTQIKSGIGTKPKHRGTLRALGLHGIGTSNTLPDRPEIRGMIARVPHLVRVEDGRPDAVVPSHRRTPAGAASATGAVASATSTGKES